MWTSLSRLRKWHENKKFTKAERYVIGPYFESGILFEQGNFDLYFENFGGPSEGFDYLIPLQQAKNYLQWVASETGHHKYLKGVEDKQLIVAVPQNAEPRLLGSIKSLEEYEAIDTQTRTNNAEHVEQKKAAKARERERKREKKALLIRSWMHSVRNVREHLGLGMDAYPHKENLNVLPDPNRVLPVFISLDCEAYEKSTNIITEVGLAVLDTARIPPLDQLPKESMADLDLESVSWDGGFPRTRAAAIAELIETRHFRISEHKYYKNGDYVADASERFNFGTSEFVSIKNMPRVLGECFRLTDENGVRRKVIVIGHDVKQDIDMVKRLIGYDIWNIKDMEVIDTTNMYKAIKDELNPRGLGTVLSEFGIAGWNLHNAGNDAAYTLAAMIHMADHGMPPPKTDKNETDEFAASLRPNVYPAPEDDDIEVLAAKVEKLPTGYVDFEDMIDGGTVKFDKQEGDVKKRNRRND
ncbi:hypothetical protein FPQ18DRAFT_304770 [Pyronema domesticum]|uniref:Similar to Uncharacterized nucleoloar protein C2C4.08 acc. no. O14041 n=1 Tax=Pyronema omphalodes (strain CBS 100304) TaxID=1076935 RepID=U4L2A0_PYROM|nr:hypothetical protein FPQ18DRAFT_304770 [Pyronema domesticum]CCX10401.1 Similar to Uncharacterized nucleoloar protein C2C4.08; acc. no. O14041 [Pyronema omphalodes CBS 100304]